jgi:hypothetical protein
MWRPKEDYSGMSVHATFRRYSASRVSPLGRNPAPSRSEHFLRQAA